MGSQTSICLDDINAGDHSNLDSSQNASYFEDRNIHVIKNHHKDQKLDKDILDQDLVIENIEEMIAAKLPIV